MKTIWDYPVTYKYGYSDAYGGDHSGEDRGNSTAFGLPVPVNGHTIGTVGWTGKVSPKNIYGSHTHVGKYVGSTSMNPRGGGAILADDAVVTQIDAVGNTANGKFVRVNSGGVDWVYLHLNSVNVKVGDKLKPIKEGLVLEEQPPVFNAKYYLEANPGLVKAGITLKTAKDHWLKYGIKEGRISAPNFAVKEYIANYSDLQKAFGTKYPQAVKHYFNHGINEGRAGRKRNSVSNAAQVTLDKIKGILGV